MSTSSSVYWFSFIYNRPEDISEHEFSESFNDIKDDLFKVCGAKSTFMFQLEQGETTHRLHYQGMVHAETKMRPCEVQNKIGWGYWQHAVKNQQENLKKYCMKQNTRVAGPWADKEVYMGQDLPTTLRGWQKKHLEILTSPMEDRMIYWFIDEQGGAGKSKFAKYMQFHYGIPKLTFGKTCDLLNIVSKFQMRKGYIFDLSRTKPHDISMDDIYSAMENIKNGHFCNTKYETDIILMLPPHIIIYANWAPDTERLSPDRWIIKNINEPIASGSPSVEDLIPELAGDDHIIIP